MKKILEVLQYGDDVRFDTDIDAIKHPDAIPETISMSAFAMVTKLWGGKETSVLAMIRALAIADLACSVNREEMIDFLDDASAEMARTMTMAQKEIEKKGGKIVTFLPGEKRPFPKS